MQITDREITKDELQFIYEDFRKIEIADGVPQRPCERYQFIAEDGDKIIGFASGLTEHRWFYLSDLWVDEAYRRRGIGSDLLCRLERKAQAEGMEHVYTWTSGLINPIFYEKQGYKTFTLFEDFYEVKGYHRFGYYKDLV